MLKDILAFIKWYLVRNKYKPTKDNIARMIDQHLGSGTGQDDGRIIRIQYGKYHYYIVRSLIKRA